MVQLHFVAGCSFGTDKSLRSQTERSRAEKRRERDRDGELMRF